MSLERTPGKPMLLLSKWRLMGLASSNPELSAADHAVLWWLCELYQASKGYAYPSLASLASFTRRDLKTIKRSVKRLSAVGLVSVTKRGTRAAASQYRPVFELGESWATKPLGAPVSPIGGADVHSLGAPAPPYSSYEPGYETGFIDGGGPAPATAGAGGTAGAAPEAAPSRPNTGRRFPAFWEVFPKATNVFKTESALQELLAEGVALDDILQGAKSYSMWIKAQPWAGSAKYISGPLNWLAARRWLDDFAVPQKTPAKAPERPATAPQAPAGTTGAKGARVAPGSPPRLALVTSALTREQLAVIGAFKKIKSCSNAYASEKQRAVDRLRRAFPGFADYVVNCGNDPWPAVSAQDAQAAVALLHAEWGLISARLKAKREAHAARHAAT